MAAIESQQPSCQRQALASETVGEQPEMADAHEAFGQHVEEESAQELHCVQGHDALLAAVRIILIAEGNAFPVEGQQAVIGNGDAMGVAAQVAERLGRSAERWLGIDDPLLVLQSVHQLFKQLPILEGDCGTAAVQRSVAVEALQSEQELVAKDATKHRDGQQEARMRMDPALVVG